ncbi:MAG: bifunctional enoyl-CoA hydratase/phosphate acetyltransferase [Candidatus Izemoplasmataceae bacterium]
MIRTIEELINTAKQIKTKPLIVACAEDEHVLEAVELARKEDIIDPILVGHKEEILKIMNDLNINHTYYKIIDEKDKEKASLKAVKLVHNEKEAILMKGLVDTSIILKAALNKEFGLRTENRISHVSVMESANYHKLLLMSDGAMNIAPTLDEKRQIIENSVKIAHALGNERPNVAIIGAVEKINPQMEATLDARDLKKMNEDGIIKNCVVSGPFAIDNAINKEAALHKGIEDPAAGEADILIMPRIEAGNVFYKTMMFLANAKSASVIAGAQIPIVLTSRADSTMSKYYSIALSALVANIS